MADDEMLMEWLTRILPERVIAKLEAKAKAEKLSEKEKQKLFEATMQSYLQAQVDPGEAVGKIGRAHV